MLDDGSEVRVPIAGVVAGLRAATHDVSVVVPVDTPRVRPETLRVLAAACRDAAMPGTGPLPGAYRKTALPALERCLAEGRLSLWEALRELDTLVVDVDAGELANVNTPDELRAL